MRDGPDRMHWVCKLCNLCKLCWVGLMCKVCAADGGKSCTQVTDPEKGVEYDEIHVQVSLLRCGTGF